MSTCKDCKYFQKIVGMIDRDKNSAGICFGSPPTMVMMMASAAPAGIQTAQGLQPVPVALNVQVSAERIACALFAKTQITSDNVIALNRKPDPE